MHNDMPYNPIQCQGHWASEVPKIALFKVYVLRHLQRELANDHRFLKFVLVFVSRDLELGGVSAVSPLVLQTFSDFNEIWYVHRGR